MKSRTRETTRSSLESRSDFTVPGSSSNASYSSTVASATEELTASIGEIGQQVKRSSEMAEKAAEEARRTDAVVDGLLSGTQKIGEVVTLIQTIAS